MKKFIVRRTSWSDDPVLRFMIIYSIERALPDFLRVEGIRGYVNETGAKPCDESVKLS